MERILDELQVSPSVKNKEYADLLARAGMDANVLAVGGYEEIKPEAMAKYLSGLIDKFLQTFPHTGLADWGNYSDAVVAQRTIRTKRGTFLHPDSEYAEVRANWHEVSISDYKFLPPTHILNKIIQERPNFDELRIVTVSVGVNPVKDPLLIGIKNGRRFLIDWWDNDIDPTELMK